MTAQKPHIIIIGAGFGGLTAAKELKNTDCQVTLIDRHNYHLFQPLLYQVATAALSPQEIASPIRAILRKQNNATVLLDTLTQINTKTQKITTKSGKKLSYDYLILATGARHSYFGKRHWEKFAPGIKNIDDAIDMRRKILLTFEKAEMELDPQKRKQLLTFVIVGAGPTGVELAGAIAELAYHTLMADFNNISHDDVTIHLLDGAPKILTSFPESLTKHAHDYFNKMNVIVTTSAFVSDITAEGVRYGDHFIAASTVLWCAGVQASKAAQWLDIPPATNAGHLAVDHNCTVVGFDNIFAVGDTAHYLPEGSDQPLPGVAPVAKQQGAFVARYLTAKIANKPLPIFQYKNYGNMAMIGRHAAIADFGFFKIWGRIGWLMWAFVHLYFLISFKQRFVVAMSWLHQYVTYKRGARLITKDDPLNMED